MADLQVPGLGFLPSFDDDYLFCITDNVLAGGGLYTDYKVAYSTLYTAINAKITDQSLKTTDSPTFASVIITPEAEVTGATKDVIATTKSLIPVNYDGAVSIVLKTAALVAGKVIEIIDVGGYCAIGKEITISTESTEKISNQDTYVMMSPYETATLWCNGVNWFVK